MRGLRADLLQACRHYLTTPGSSAIAVVVLAVAMAVLAAFLALFNDFALSLHPGFEDSRTPVSVGQTDGSRMFYVPHPLIERIQNEAATVDAIAGTLGLGQTLERNGERHQIATALVTARFFPDLRPRMQLGRPFEARDHDLDAEPVVILSDAFWREHFSARPEALGQSVRVYGPNRTLYMNGAGSPSERRLPSSSSRGCAAISSRASSRPQWLRCSCWSARPRCCSRRALGPRGRRGKRSPRRCCAKNRRSIGMDLALLARRVAQRARPVGDDRADTDQAVIWASAASGQA